MKSLIFQDWGVRAILDGSKTQTRRIMKPQPDEVVGDMLTPHIWYAVNNGIHDCDNQIKPKFQIGETIYVRETWMPETEQGIPTGGIIYKATNNPEPDGNTPLKWKSPLHLSEKNARIFLKITDIKVERVQDISEEDAQREGVKPFHPNLSYKTAFKLIWKDINGKESWEQNPWVWVYSFKMVKP